MPSFHRPCLVCGELSKGTRCATHERAYRQLRESKRDTPERQARKQALYGGNYRKRRQALLATATHCHICRKAFIFGDKLEADHLEAGNPDSPLAPAHAYCNQSRGNKPL